MRAVHELTCPFRPLEADRQRATLPFVAEEGVSKLGDVEPPHRAARVKSSLDGPRHGKGNDGKATCKRRQEAVQRDHRVFAGQKVEKQRSDDEHVGLFVAGDFGLRSATMALSRRTHEEAAVVE